MPIGWAITLIVFAVFVEVAVMALLKEGARADEISAAYDEGYRKGRESIHDEYEKRRVMTDRMYRRVMRIYSGEIERARLEVRHLWVMAGMEQEGVE